MSESQGIGMAWPLAALSLAAAAIFVPAPAAVVLGSLAVASLAVPLVAGCLSGEPEPSCGWTHPEREKRACRQPALAHETEPPGRNWADSIARDNAASRSR